MIHIPFLLPDITEEEINEVAQALRSGWITTGPRTKELERQVAAYCQNTSGRAACLNSQSACAEMALRLQGIGEGDEVIVPAYTYTATASAVCHVGAKPVLVDCAKDSVEMDPAALARAITEKTKAVMPVDLGGVPCDYDLVSEIIRDKKALFRPASPVQEAMGRISVTADTAHAFGASRGGKMAGSLADFSAFSFHAVKNFTTAEGGALTWNSIDGVDDNDLYYQLQLLSLHGQSKDALAKTNSGDWEYDVVGTYYKCNMTDIAAAMGLAQFRHYDRLLRRRKQLIGVYDAALRPLGLQTLEHYTDTVCSNGHLYLTRVPGITAQQRNEIINKMAEKGVVCNVHYKPLPMLTAYKQLGYDIADFPNAYDYFANEITLPLYTALTDEQAAYVIECYTDILKEYL